MKDLFFFSNQIFFCASFRRFETKNKKSNYHHRKKKFEFLFYEFLIFKFILHQIHIYVLFHVFEQKRQKIFITKNIFFNVFYWKSVCNLLYVKTAIMHVKFFDFELVILINKFNDAENSLIVLMIMYQIFAQKMNLNRCYFRIIVITSIVNVSNEIQTWFRVIWINCIAKTILWFSNRFEKWLIKNINLAIKARDDNSRHNFQFLSSILWQQADE